MKTTRRGFFGFFAGVAALSPFAAKARLVRKPLRYEGGAHNVQDWAQRTEMLNDVIYDVTPTETPFLDAMKGNYTQVSGDQASSEWWKENLS